MYNPFKKKLGKSTIIENPNALKQKEMAHTLANGGSVEVPSDVFLAKEFWENFGAVIQEDANKTDNGMTNC